MHYLIDDEKAVEKAGGIVKALPEAQSPRLSNITGEMAGRSESNYKAVQPFVAQVYVKAALMRQYRCDLHLDSLNVRKTDLH